MAKKIRRQRNLAAALALINEGVWDEIVERKVEEVLAKRVQTPSAAVASARERGATWAAEEYASPENWSLDQAAGILGISARVINERRNAWRYYALVPKGQQRGFRFPKWQFDAEITRLEAVLSVLRDASAGCWTVHSFMVTPNSQLNGMSPRDWILDSKANLQRLLQIAQARFTSDQGAG